MLKSGCSLMATFKLVSLTPFSLSLINLESYLQLSKLLNLVKYTLVTVLSTGS